MLDDAASFLALVVEGEIVLGVAAFSSSWAAAQTSASLRPPSCSASTVSPSNPSTASLGATDAAMFSSSFSFTQP